MRRPLASAATALAVFAASGTASAVRPRGGALTKKLVRPSLETIDGKALRAHVSVTWGQAPQVRQLAWARFLGDAGTAWHASWDDATHVPSRIFGRGVAAPGAVASASTAERHARAFLARHIDLLAPGASASDFVLVSNHLRNGLRVLGFRQTHDGLEVLGGQVSFRYKNDRLFVIGSEALPDVQIRRAGGLRADPDVARLFAESWVLTDAAAEAHAGQVGTTVILPLVGSGGVLEYRVVNRVDVAARNPIGRYAVYADAATGAVVAREQTLRFADGVVRFDAPVRYPLAERVAYPVRSASVTVNGHPATTDESGSVSWDEGGSATVLLRAEGPLVMVTNAVGAPAEKQVSVAPSGTATWSEASDELLDAQLTAFVHARIVKDYAREHLNPGLDWLDTQLPVNVNIEESCNAYSDGNSINFFQSNGQCENTGRLADVVYHEFGHSLHANSLVEGVGAFDGAHSEGLSDYLAASVTGDPGMGRGFFLSEGPLRHIDPTDNEAIWPRDIGEMHATGLIFAGAMWDLRKLLIEQYGEEAGIALANKLYYSTLERATNIPTTYTEILAEDDDDGDLSNGTPNSCDINAAFGMHGLRPLSADITPLAAEMPGQGGFPISVNVGGLFGQCPGDGLSAARVEWFLRGQDPAGAETIELTAAEDGSFTGVIPDAVDGDVVRFRLIVDFLDGSFRGFPDNPADARYEFYVGEVVPLYCTDFESDPFADGWTHALSSGADEQGADDWAWGPPMAPLSAGDPPAAFSGESMIGNDLGGTDHDGLYQPDLVNYAESPAIELEQYSDVRVQYWRWLTVEDAFFDQATVYANGELAWRNLNSDQGDQSTIQHVDREWRFQDVPVSHLLSDKTLKVRFEIGSDGGLEFGGWNIDDFCVVANPRSICGDGEVTGGESCDEGDANSDDEADACRTTCREATCGDGVVDEGESCDDGNTVGGDACDPLCGDSADGGGCGCRAGARGDLGGGSITLLLLVVAFVRRRGRARTRTCA